MLILCICSVLTGKPALIPVRVHISQTQTGLNMSRVLRPELSMTLFVGLQSAAWDQLWFVSLVSLLTDFEWKGNRHIHTCQGFATWFFIPFSWHWVSRPSHMCIAYSHFYLLMYICMIYGWLGGNHACLWNLTGWNGNIFKKESVIPQMSFSWAQKVLNASFHHSFRQD